MQVNIKLGSEYISDGFRTGVEVKEWHIDRRKDFRAPGKEKPVFKGRDR